MRGFSGMRGKSHWSHEKSNCQSEKRGVNEVRESSFRNAKKGQFSNKLRRTSFLEMARNVSYLETFLEDFRITYHCHSRARSERRCMNRVRESSFRNAKDEISNYPPRLPPRWLMLSS
jgi:hypothetical protein